MENQTHNEPEVGPFVLRPLLADLPLSAEGGGDDVQINCVEFLGMENFSPWGVNALSQITVAYTL